MAGRRASSKVSAPRPVATASSPSRARLPRQARASRASRHGAGRSVSVAHSSDTTSRLPRWRARVSASQSHSCDSGSRRSRPWRCRLRSSSIAKKGLPPVQPLISSDSGCRGSGALPRRSASRAVTWSPLRLLSSRCSGGIGAWLACSSRRVRGASASRSDGRSRPITTRPCRSGASSRARSRSRVSGSAHCRSSSTSTSGRQSRARARSRATSRLSSRCGTS